jgi:chromodomain-helicase-DNA-binding protein 1
VLLQFANVEDRNYTVNNYWPKNNVTATQVKGMYQKMLGSEINGKQNGQQTNGQVNGS